MKIRIEIEVGPTELREFLGLPDVSGLQKDVIEAVRNKMVSGAAGFDPVSLLKTWIPQGLMSVGDWQNVLKRALQNAQVTTTSVGEDEARPKKKSRSRSTRSKSTRG